MPRTFRPSPLALAILALLYEEPTHPYRMQQLIKERAKDEVINVRQRTSLYQVIDRLLRAELIAVQETTRTEKRPERTLYALTDAGHEALRPWLREMLATPTPEFPEFPAALAHLTLLTPEDATLQFIKRASILEGEIARLDAQLREGGAFLPRIFMIETEYLRATLHAEATWVRAVLDDLRTGRFTWDEASLRAQFAAPSQQKERL